MKKKFTFSEIVLKLFLILVLIIIHDQICINYHKPTECIIQTAKVDGIAYPGEIRQKRCLRHVTRILIAAIDMFVEDTGIIPEGEADIKILREKGYLPRNFEIPHPSCKYNIIATDTFLIECELHNNNFKGNLNALDLQNCLVIRNSLNEEIKKYYSNHDKFTEGRLDIDLLKSEGLLKPEFTISSGCNYKISYAKDFDIVCKYHGPGYHSPLYAYNKDYRSPEDRQKDYEYEKNQELIKKAAHIVPLIICVAIVLFAF